MKTDWKIGDIAILINAVNNPHLNGMEATITLPFCWCTSTQGHWKGMRFCCQVEAANGMTYTCEPHQLKLRDDPNTKSVWDDCVFKPEREMVTEE